MSVLDNLCRRSRELCPPVCRSSCGDICDAARVKEVFDKAKPRRSACRRLDVGLAALSANRPSTLRSICWGCWASWITTCVRVGRKNRVRFVGRVLYGRLLRTAPETHAEQPPFPSSTGSSQWAGAVLASSSPSSTAFARWRCVTRTSMAATECPHGEVPRPSPFSPRGMLRRQVNSIRRALHSRLRLCVRRGPRNHLSL